MLKSATKTVSQFLRETVWMAGLSEPIRARVCGECYDTYHVKNDVVARRGDMVNSWIGVADGFLKVLSHDENGKIVMFSGIPKNSWVGEGSVIKREPRRYDLVATVDSRTVHVPRATFLWLLQISFEFNHFIIDHLNERLGQFLAMTETDRISDPTIRLARAIAGLFNPVIYPSMGPVLKISQTELGELAGLSRQRVNSSLALLERQGLLQRAYGGIFVENLAALREFAESHHHRNPA
jgi:CRP-like cAMP-binding protein